jgi:apolipoprotein D and lipocalin family protein
MSESTTHFPTPRCWIAAIALLGLYLGAPALSSGQEAVLDPPTPVDSVDLGRYAGLWFEIARMPNRFQRQCARRVTAYYAVREDGRLDMSNRCLKHDGTMDMDSGVARVVEPTSNARLEVSFFRLLFLNLFWGDYWILGLDEEYRWAIVGTPDRQYGWILGRRPDLPPAVLTGIFSELRRQGYNPDAFEMTIQTLER